MAQVARQVSRRYSPEQIVGAWKSSSGLRISHETIYRQIRWDFQKTCGSKNQLRSTPAQIATTRNSRTMAATLPELESETLCKRE